MKMKSISLESPLSRSLSNRHDVRLYPVKPNSTYNKPVVAYALTDAGKKITGKAGFTRLNDSDLIIYHPAQLKQ